MSRILVVEDDSSVCRVISALLQDDGHQVDTASSKEEATKRITARKYHVVIADMRMESENSGLEVLRMAKEKDPLTQVIVLTGYGDVTNAVESMEAGAFTYLEKTGRDVKQYDILRNQVQKALAYGDNMAYASGELTNSIDAAADDLVSALSLIEGCIALLKSAAHARKRLLKHLLPEGNQSLENMDSHSNGRK